MGKFAWAVDWHKCKCTWCFYSCLYAVWNNWLDEPVAPDLGPWRLLLSSLHASVSLPASSSKQPSLSLCRKRSQLSVGCLHHLSPNGRGPGLSEWWMLQRRVKRMQASPRLPWSRRRSEVVNIRLKALLSDSFQSGMFTASNCHVNSHLLRVD